MNSESIWKDAVEYSSSNIILEQRLFQNVEWLSTENSLPPTNPINSEVDQNFEAHAAINASSNINLRSSFIGLPVSKSFNECVTRDFELSATHRFGMLPCAEQREEDLIEKRTRNNKACKKFRKARKSRREQLYIMEEKMLRENSSLKNRISSLENEIEKWKDFFSNQK